MRVSMSHTTNRLLDCFSSPNAARGSKDLIQNEVNSLAVTSSSLCRRLASSRLSSNLPDLTKIQQTLISNLLNLNGKIWPAYQSAPVLTKQFLGLLYRSLLQGFSWDLFSPQWLWHSNAIRALSLTWAMLNTGQIRGLCTGEDANLLISRSPP